MCGFGTALLKGHTWTCSHESRQRSCDCLSRCLRPPDTPSARQRRCHPRQTASRDTQSPYICSQGGLEWDKGRPCADIGCGCIKSIGPPAIIMKPGKAAQEQPRKSSRAARCCCPLTLRCPEVPGRNRRAGRWRTPASPPGWLTWRKQAAGTVDRTGEPSRSGVVRLASTRQRRAARGQTAHPPRPCSAAFPVKGLARLGGANSCAERHTLFRARGLISSIALVMFLRTAACW